MQYNLARNGSLESLTSSGTGNKSLSWTELESLMDGTTTSGGITLIPADVLYLECDLSNRIKLDSVRLYANDLTKLANIDFYYKNNESDDYTPCSKNVSTFYYPTLPDPKAPRFVLTTISGVDIQLYEYMLINDDITVNFGLDGSLYAKYLDNCPIGETGDPTVVPIFNNSTNPIPADAYCCIDYTGSEADNYIKISSSENGVYYSIDDGAVLEDNKDNSAYRWDMGKHSNTTVSGDNVVLIDPTISGGVYTSPIFSLNNKFMASYFITDGTTKSGTSSISYNENVYNGTIRVRSSNTKPLTINEVFWLRAGNYIVRSNVYDGQSDEDWGSIAALTARTTAVNRRNGDVYAFVGSAYHCHGQFKRYDYNGNELYASGDTCVYSFSYVGIDKSGGFWGIRRYQLEFNPMTARLVHYNHDLVELYLYDTGNIDTVYDLAVEMDSNGVWYTNQLDNMLIHKDNEGTTLNTTILNEPRAICGTLDNGCWVIDNTDEKAYRYNFSGALIKTVSIERTVTRMCTDMTDGFWYISRNHIYHVTSGGIENVDVEVDRPTRIEGGYDGCAIWSELNDWIKYVNNSGDIVRTFQTSGETAPGALFSFKHENFVEFRNTANLIPVSYDPVWNGSLEWKEVKKNGYFLPKTAYHQAEITLRCQGVTSPFLNKLIISPAIKVGDILAQTSKNVYIKTDVPDGASIQDYETKIRAWWGINI